MSDQPMNDQPSGPEEFRSYVRSFFDGLPELFAAASQKPDGPTDGNDSEGVRRAKLWRAALYDAGLAGFGYQTDAGGLGNRPEESAIFSEESRGRVPNVDSLFGLGVNMALPMIRDHGSDLLRKRFIQPGLRGEEVWCQLYSEPNAGSDLASLATKAERDGDEWIVSGQKVWTSNAQNADLAILIARTDSNLPKHRGITMFVISMRQPGVTVRPLRQMTGISEFNEVFLDEARIPAEWVLGDVNDGWRMATALLAHERIATGTSSVSEAVTRSARPAAIRFRRSNLSSWLKRRAWPKTKIVGRRSPRRTPANAS